MFACQFRFLADGFVKTSSAWELQSRRWFAELEPRMHDVPRRQNVIINAKTLQEDWRHQLNLLVESQCSSIGKSGGKTSVCPSGQDCPHHYSYSVFGNPSPVLGEEACRVVCMELQTHASPMLCCTVFMATPLPPMRDGLTKKIPKTQPALGKILDGNGGAWGDSLSAKGYVFASQEYI